MELGTQCSAWVQDGDKCRNGFPTEPLCRGFCGENRVPICCNERQRGRFWPETGRPLTMDERKEVREAKEVTP